MEWAQFAVDSFYIGLGNFMLYLSLYQFPVDEEYF